MTLVVLFHIIITYVKFPLLDSCINDSPCMKVAGTSHIVTSPALLESTSIVLSYGIDLFLTRVAPSKTFDILSENFNKVQLVLTVGALVAGIMVTRPIVRRKIRRQRWYYS